MRSLVIDDDRYMSKLLEQALRGERFDCSVSHSAEEALLQVHDQFFDLIVLDLGLPGMSGLELLRRLRASGNTALVLIVSAHGRIEDRVTGLDFGADDYLVKNFSLAEFVARVRALLRRRLDKKHNLLVAGPLVLNLETKEVRLRQKILSLSKKEFQLLFTFLAHKNRVLSRADLSEEVWGDPLDEKSNVIDVYIRSLRNKLGEDRKLIQTVRGHGYLLTEK